MEIERISQTETDKTERQTDRTAAIVLRSFWLLSTAFDALTTSLHVCNIRYVERSGGGNPHTHPHTHTHTREFMTITDILRAPLAACVCVCECVMIRYMFYVLG